MHPEPLRFEVAPTFFIAADAFGSPENPPVLLLHGGGQTRHSWGDTAQRIAEAGYYALALDARGHGDSSWSASAEYGIEFLVEDLKAVIRQLGKKPALVGASMGGLTALLAEGESEQSLASAIVLVDIAPKAEQKGIERIFAFMSANAAQGFASLDEAADAVAAYLPHRPRTEDTSRLEKNLRQRADGRWYWHWDPVMLKVWKRQTTETTPDQQMRNEARLFRAAQRLTVPTLIVRGGMSDVVSERIMAEFLDAVPHVRSVSVSGAGHMVAGDSNHAFTRAVLQFLEEVFPSA
jgi:non-heme chloroperoxidase